MVPDMAQGRDLSRYERLMLVDPGHRLMSETQTPTLSQSRSLLWSHWAQKKRAYLVLSLSSVDETSTSHVFVEPDDSGRWRIYWRIVRTDGEVDDLPTGYDMTWVVPGDWDKSGVPIAGGQSSEPNRNELEFRNTCGEFERDF